MADMTDLKLKVAITDWARKHGIAEDKIEEFVNKIFWVANSVLKTFEQ